VEVIGVGGSVILKWILNMISLGVHRVHPSHDEDPLRTVVNSAVNLTHNTRVSDRHGF
jgi:hypothetical protein